MPEIENEVGMQIHVQINKIELLETEADQFDIITVSETWLSQTDANSSIHLTNLSSAY